MEEKKFEKLNDNELENVSGSILGDWLESKKTYKSGASPKFKVGDRVVHNFLNMDWKGTVIAVSTEKLGIINKEFTYTVRHGKNGIVDEGVYESALALDEGW